jgi:tartrate/fumarate subfamily iron-sulfur-dependent hydro-lyase alpha chain
MIAIELFEETMYEAMRLAATRLPPDVRLALERVLAEETDALARAHVQSCLLNADQAEAGAGLVCGDTGYPLFFVRLGRGAAIAGGVPSLYQAAQRATVRATTDSFLRPTMVDPLSRHNPGNNLGPGMPKVELVYGGIDGTIDLIAAPKGGGSEIFGTFYRMLYPSDGRAGIKKFIIECIKDACYAGKICPPAIVGVGIGGTADLCMKLAKEAALLRPLGTVNADAVLAGLEAELLAASRQLGIGPMGSRGINCLIGLHLATALTHTAALPVAFNAQCLIGRRWRARIAASGQVEFSGDIADWQDGHSGQAGQGGQGGHDGQAGQGGQGGQGGY